MAPRGRSTIRLLLLASLAAALASFTAAALTETFTQEAGCVWTQPAGAAKECGPAQNPVKCKCKTCTIQTTVIPPNPSNPKDQGTTINLCKCTDRGARKRLRALLDDTAPEVCPITTVEEDPVFALGGPYDRSFMFQGMPDRSFCLLSDRSLQVNAHFIKGWTRKAEGDSDTLESGTYMDALGVLAVPPGFSQERTVEVYLPDASQPALAVKVDGQHVPFEELAEIQRMVMKEPVHVTRGSFGSGAAQLPRVEVSVAGLGRLLVKVAKNPYAPGFHINFDILELGDVSSLVHGVLGQTFRPDKMDRFRRGELHFKGTDLQGEGIVDGGVEDYVTSSVTAPDCAFNQYLPGDRDVEPVQLHRRRKLFATARGEGLTRLVMCEHAPGGLQCQF